MLIRDNKQVYEAFGQWIRDARERQQLYQYEVAEKMGITQSYYHYIEIGKRKLSLPMAMNVCSVLGLDLNDFVRMLGRRKPKIIRPEAKEE